MKQTSMIIFGIVLKLGIIAMIVVAILAVLLRYLSIEGLKTFNSIFNIIQ